MHRYVHACIDGFFTGIDPLGAAIGHATQYPYCIGYLADSKYDLISHSEMFRSRDKGEQVFKGFGDGIGLAANIAGNGIPQGVFAFYNGIYFAARKMRPLFLRRFQKME